MFNHLRRPLEIVEYEYLTDKLLTISDASGSPIVASIV